MVALTHGVVVPLYERLIERRDKFSVRVYGISPVAQEPYRSVVTCKRSVGTPERFGTTVTVGRDELLDLGVGTVVRLEPRP